MQFIKENCRHLEVPPSRVKIGDIVVFGVMEFKVETIQNECFDINNLKQFTLVILRDFSGGMHPIRTWQNKKKVEVYRAKR